MCCDVSLLSVIIYLSREGDKIGSNLIDLSVSFRQLILEPLDVSCHLVLQPVGLASELHQQLTSDGGLQLSFSSMLRRTLVITACIQSWSTCLSSAFPRLSPRSLDGLVLTNHPLPWTPLFTRSATPHSESSTPSSFGSVASWTHAPATSAHKAFGHGKKSW